MVNDPVKLLEEELKSKVAADWFAAYGTTRIIGKVDFCVAYITGAPAAADLVARIKGLPDWLRATWETLLTAERSERGTRDNRMARPVELRGSADYLVSAELGNEIVGGRCALTMTAGDFPPKTVQFFVRGKNPRDAVARAYIDAHIDAEFRDFAWMIAKHESKSGGRVRGVDQKNS